MCNLYTVRLSAPGIAEHFDVDESNVEIVPRETTPRTMGVIVRAYQGRRVMQTLSWGFPRPSRIAPPDGEEPKPVNLVANLTSPMWDRMVVEPRFRCLIPITHFAEPAGGPGAKTRTWFRVKDQPVFAWAGFCRNTPEWGPVYAGMTMESNATVMPLNERMPVLLAPQDYETWLHGSIRDVIDFQFRPLPADRLAMLETKHRWRSGQVPAMPRSSILEPALMEWT